MSKHAFFLGLLTLLTTSYAVANPNVSNKSSEAEQLGYGLGYRITETALHTFGEFDLQTFLAGVDDALKKRQPQLSREEMNQSFDRFTKRNELNKQKSEQSYQKFQQTLEKNALQQQLFLQENLKKANVKRTRSGLQYEVLQQGQGKKLKKPTQVALNYEGRLLNGMIFDSSIARQQSQQFAVKNLIQGLQEGLKLMPTGSIYRFYIPAQLAYGEVGAGDVPPNSLVIFDVELLPEQP